MKIKHNILLPVLLLITFNTFAQVKIGTNPNTISANVNLEVESAANSKFVITKDSSKVGVGTNAPTSKLDINGKLRVRDVPQSSTNNLVPLYADTNGNIVTGPIDNTYLIDIKYSTKSGNNIAVGSNGAWMTTTTYLLPLNKENSISIPAGKTGVISVDYGAWGDDNGTATAGSVNPGLVIEYSMDGGTTWAELYRLATNYYNVTGSSIERWNLNFSNEFPIISGANRIVKFRLKAFSPDSVGPTHFIGWYIKTTLMLNP